MVLFEKARPLLLLERGDGLGVMSYPPKCGVI